MYSSKSFVLLKLSLSPSTLGLLHTLHTEFNSFLPSTATTQQSFHPSNNTKEILEGFFQLIISPSSSKVTFV